MRNVNKNSEMSKSLQNAFSKSLPTRIYLTFDENDGEIYAAFTSETRCKIEAEESGCGMTSLELHYGERE